MEMSFSKKEDILLIKKFIESNVINDYQLYQIIHTIMLLHGKYVCKSNPNCCECVICDKCQYYLSNDLHNQLKLF